MALHPKSKIVALRALLAVTWAEERRLLTTINSDQTSAEEMSTALSALAKLWTNIVLKLADIEDATETSASRQLAAHCNPEQNPVIPIDDRTGNFPNNEPGWRAPSDGPSP
jgi:hypothetical protein